VSQHRVAQPVGVTLAGSRMFDDLFGNCFPNRPRVVGHKERAADVVERDAHGVRHLGLESAVREYRVVGHRCLPSRRQERNPSGVCANAPPIDRIMAPPAGLLESNFHKFAVFYVR
jgi:hypothetical protein